MTHRHRAILADLISDSTDLLLLSGYCYYNNSDDPEHQTGLKQIQQYLREETIFQGLLLSPLTKINLHDLNPEQHEPGMFWWPVLGEITPGMPLVDHVLCAIARGECTPFFVSPQLSVLLAPYDGGMDIILPDVSTRNFYRQKYRAWLSGRPNGL